jgi:type I restriction enzyme R subunit
MIIADEFSRSGFVEPGRLFESPLLCYVVTGDDLFFPDAQVEVMVEPLHPMSQTDVPEEVA